MSRRGDADGPTLTPKYAKLATRVRVTTGALAGLEGIIVRSDVRARDEMKITVRFDNGTTLTDYCSRFQRYVPNYDAKEERKLERGTELKKIKYMLRGRKVAW